MKKNKIFYVCDSNYKYDSRVQKELLALKKISNKVILVCWNREKNDKNTVSNYELNGITFKRLEICVKASYGGGISNLISLVRFEINLYKLLIKEVKNNSVIHACNLPCGLAAMFICKIKKTQYIYDIFDYYCDSHFENQTSFLYKITQFLETNVINNANTIIICSEKRNKQIGKTKAKKIVVIHNSPEKSNLDNYENIDLKVSTNDKVKVCYVGLIDQSRPIVILANIISKLNNIEFYCGGYGNDSHIICEMAKRFDNIKYFGKMDYKDVLYLEKQCDILPALYSPKLKNHQFAAPNKFYEALMLGKPLLMLKNTGVDDLVSKYELGVICEYNEESIKKSLIDISNNIEYWRLKSEKSKRIFDEIFSWEIMEERISGLYSD